MIGRLSYQTVAPAHYSIGEMTLRGDGRPRFNIAPGQKHSVIRIIDGSPAIGEMTWGRTLAGVPFNHDLAGVPLDDIGFEGLPVGAQALHRCIIPADGLYVWERQVTGYRRWYFSLSQPKAVGLLAIWIELPGQHWIPHQTFFTILHGTFPNLVGGICHHFPIVVPVDRWATWLNERSTRDELVQEIQEAAETRFTVWEVGPHVDSAANDNHWCNKPQTRSKYVFDADITKSRRAPTTQVRLFFGPRGVARSSWVEVQRRVAGSIVPFEGGRADGNSSR